LETSLVAEHEVAYQEGHSSMELVIAVNPSPVFLHQHIQKFYPADELRSASPFSRPINCYLRVRRASNKLMVAGLFFYLENVAA
jgi:hypothetical protein